MNSIFEYSQTQLAVKPEVIEAYGLQVSDFLGNVNTKHRDYIIIQDNYFNRMLLKMWPDSVCPLNEVLDTRLDAYQIADVYKGLSLRTFCNFNRMGYGKTVETCAHLKATKAKQILIVAPKAVLEQWKQHIEVWYPEMTSYISILKSAKGLEGLIANYRLHRQGICLLLNYEKLIQGPIMSLLQNIVWDMIVFDEAHYLKNPKSKRTIAANMLSAHNRCLLTGTPVMSHYDNLWSMLHILGWKYSGLYYWPWVEKFCEIRDDFFGKQIVGPTRNERDLEHLKRYIDLIAIRNPDLQLTKGKQVYTVELELDKPQCTFYNKIKKTLLDELPENLTITNGAVKCIRLRQATSCPHQLNFHEEKIMWGVKFEWIRNFLDSTDESVLILSQYVHTIELLQEYLKDLDPAVHIGSMNDNVRKIELSRFTSKMTRVLIATTQSIGTGVDGLQNVCRLGIVVDADYSPEINRQAEDRLDRLGQKEMVCWYYLECKKTFDTRVRKINDLKNKSIKELLINE